MVGNYDRLGCYDRMYANGPMDWIAYRGRGHCVEVGKVRESHDVHRSITLIFLHLASGCNKVISTCLRLRWSAFFPASLDTIAFVTSSLTGPLIRNPFPTSAACVHHLLDSTCAAPRTSRRGSGLCGRCLGPRSFHHVLQ